MEEENVEASPFFGEGSEIMTKLIIVKGITYEPDPCIHCSNLVYVTRDTAFCTFLGRFLDYRLSRCDGKGFTRKKREAK